MVCETARLRDLTGQFDELEPRRHGYQTGIISTRLRSCRGAPVGSSAWSEGFKGAQHPALNRAVAGSSVRRLGARALALPARQHLRRRDRARHAFASRYGALARTPSVLSVRPLGIDWSS